MKKKERKIAPYILVMLAGACLVVATAWIGLVISDSRVVEDPYTESTRDVQSSGGYQLKAEVSDFSLPNANGQDVSLSQYNSAKGVIVVFTCNHCPFAKAYEDRIQALDGKFRAQGFPVVAINPTDPLAYEEDSFEKMKAKVSSKGYTFPYLADASQEVSRKFGATKTPHVFVLSNDKGKFTVEYIGAIDDNPQDPPGVTRRFVEEAVTNLLSGKPVGTTTTKAIGCVIKWKDA
jgi:peroxiredoxin